MLSGARGLLQVCPSLEGYFSLIARPWSWMPEGRIRRAPNDWGSQHHSQELPVPCSLPRRRCLISSPGGHSAEVTFSAGEVLVSALSLWLRELCVHCQPSHYWFSSKQSRTERGCLLGHPFPCPWQLPCLSRFMGPAQKQWPPWKVCSGRAPSPRCSAPPGCHHPVG